MTDPAAILAHVSDLVHAELAQYLSNDFVIAQVTGEFLPGAAGEDYLRATVILEDGHPKLDPHTLIKFSMHMNSVCRERGFDHPTIVYANRSEIPA